MTDCKPVITLNNVVLPAPLGPMRPVTLPGCAERSTRSKREHAAEARTDTPSTWSIDRHQLSQLVGRRAVVRRWSRPFAGWIRARSFATAPPTSFVQPYGFRATPKAPSPGPRYVMFPTFGSKVADAGEQARR